MQMLRGHQDLGIPYSWNAPCWEAVAIVCYFSEWSFCRAYESCLVPLDACQHLSCCGYHNRWGSWETKCLLNCGSCCRGGQEEETGHLYQDCGVSRVPGHLDTVHQLNPSSIPSPGSCFILLKISTTVTPPFVIVFSCGHPLRLHTFLRPEDTKGTAELLSVCVSSKLLLHRRQFTLLRGQHCPLPETIYHFLSKSIIKWLFLSLHKGWCASSSRLFISPITGRSTYTTTLPSYDLL